MCTNIRYVRRGDINVALWDACIKEAANGLPYAQSGFLDAMCPNWSALVQDNYEAVMPLPRRRKWGLNYLFQPFLTPALGVFSTAEKKIDADPFLNAIPATYRLWDLTLNARNNVHQYKRWTIARTNYVLSLRRDYNDIRNSYHQNIRRELQKALNAELTIKSSIPFAEIIAVAARQYPLFTKVEDSAFDHIQQVYNNLAGSMRTYGVYNKEALLIASCALFEFGNRLIYWMPANRPESRSCGASAFLIDSIMKEHARCIASAAKLNA